MKASRDALEVLLADPPVATILGLLDRDGEEARIVGGAVRDALAGRLAGEVDIATTAVPEEVVRRAAAVGIKAVPTGLAHGTVTLIANGRGVEVTTLRRDVATDGRHATVAFGRDWNADAERRDFTINALSLSRDGVVHDTVGGRADLDARRVRFIGAPAQRIAEDYLRILRFFRFHAGFGAGAPDADALKAIVAARSGLARLSRERVRAEFLKLLAGAGVVAALEAMADCGILTLIVGGVPRLARLAHLAAIEAALGQPPDPVRRLAALALFVAEDAERLRRHLRLANAEAERLLRMAPSQPFLSAALPEAAARAALYRLGPADFHDRALLAWAGSGAPAADPGWRRLATLPERWTAPRLPVTGADLVKAGITPGVHLGEILRKVERAWFDAGFPMDAKWREEAISRAVARS